MESSCVNLAGWLVGYFALHSLMAATAVKGWLGRWLTSQQHRLLFNTSALLMLVPVVYAYYQCQQPPLWQSSLLQRIVGALLFVSGAALLWRAFRPYDTAAFLGLKKEHYNELVIQGMGRYMRHPLYSASFLLLWGLPLWLPTLAHGLIAVIGSIYLLIGTYWEEQKLLREFGAAYQQYKREVPRFWPILFRKQKK
ncbi:MAG: isoprenylcysteine carboxylmethyltransferase family protein [Saprospiraceae bacterium]